MFLAPFLFIYAFVFFLLLVFLVVLVEIGVINYALYAIGLPPGLAFAVLLGSLLGSYINLPVSRIEGGERHDAEMVSSFGVRYRVPAHIVHRPTVVAVNVGGAIIPVVLSAYLLTNHPTVAGQAIIAVAVVALVAHFFARPIPGMGIAVPMFIPPIVAAVAAYLLTDHHEVSVVAYVAGSMGTLIGADLANLGKIANLGAPVASIGGAGTFDGIFLSGIVAALLA